ncbi:WbqC family protein [Aquirufa sp.]|jgi:hypothetical protein|uniref:WbqC family protein n=1 Tax=Aquirufa sp. TaxID=2676249 RepID=UPI0037BE6F77
MHIDIHYLPSVEYCALIFDEPSIEFEVYENFPKQTYRNRSYILGANGVELLSIPIIQGDIGKQLTKDVQIDYSQDWMRRHRGAIQSAYGKAPFFEHVEPFIDQIFAKKSKFLVDLNIHFLNTIARFLQKKPQFIFTDSFQEMPSKSYWNVISPKVNYNARGIYNPVAYRQCFGTTFVPNLSVLDLVMNYGIESREILQKSLNK